MNEPILPDLAWLEDPELIAAIHRDMRCRARNRGLYRHAARAAWNTWGPFPSLHGSLFRGRPPTAADWHIN